MGNAATHGHPYYVDRLRFIMATAEEKGPFVEFAKSTPIYSCNYTFNTTSFDELTFHLSRSPGTNPYTLQEHLNMVCPCHDDHTPLSSCLCSYRKIGLTDDQVAAFTKLSYKNSTMTRYDGAQRRIVPTVEKDDNASPPMYEEKT